MTNAASGCTPHQAVKFVQNNVLEAFINLLNAKNPATDQVVLEGIYNILKHSESLGGFENPFVATFESSGGLDKIEALRYHENQKVDELVLKILEKFLGVEGEEKAKKS